MTYNGPFFVKTENGYELADVCKNCAFGDKDGCALNPCTYLWAIAQSDDDEDD